MDNLNYSIIIGKRDELLSAMSKNGFKEFDTLLESQMALNTCFDGIIDHHNNMIKGHSKSQIMKPFLSIYEKNNFEEGIQYCTDQEEASGLSIKASRLVAKNGIQNLNNLCERNGIKPFTLKPVNELTDVDIDVFTNSCYSALTKERQNESSAAKDNIVKTEAKNMTTDKATYPEVEHIPEKNFETDLTSSKGKMMAKLKAEDANEQKEEPDSLGASLNKYL